jgi:hypothetical protein
MNIHVDNSSAFILKNISISSILYLNFSWHKFRIRKKSIKRNTVLDWMISITIIVDDGFVVNN